MTVDRSLVVGMGSIGARHTRVLESLGRACAVVSRRVTPGEPVEHGAPEKSYRSIKSAVLDWGPDHVVVATETSDHLRALAELADTGFAGIAVVEKPLLAHPAELPTFPFTVVLGYQLRFHPAVLAARVAMADSAILAIDAYVGQHLATWRPGRAVGSTASARIAAGGGALRDLSHELDLVTWLGGPWQRVCALGGRSGVHGPEVDADDRWGILVELESGVIATVHLNSLDHVSQRRMSLVGDHRSIAIDLVAGTVTTASVEPGAGPDQTQAHQVERDTVLSSMHRSILAKEGLACSAEEGVAVVELIDAIEHSQRTSGWVEHGAAR